MNYLRVAGFLILSQFPFEQLSACKRDYLLPDGFVSAEREKNGLLS
jgi:hypothetical protein